MDGLARWPVREASVEVGELRASEIGERAVTFLTIGRREVYRRSLIEARSIETDSLGKLQRLPYFWPQAAAANFSRSLKFDFHVVYMAPSIPERRLPAACQPRMLSGGPS